MHVLNERCSTCVFRPGNLMELSPGRLKTLTQANVNNDSALTCHQTLGTSCPAVCRGFFDAYPTMPLRLAAAMNVLIFDPASPEHE